MTTQANAIDFESYEFLQYETCAQRIVAANEKLGKKTIIMCHQ